MALQVWLPLNGDLKNKGCADVTVTNTGATVDSTGKIGSCYSFDGVTGHYINVSYGLNVSSKNVSVCLWVKPLASLNNKIVAGVTNGSNQRLYIGVKNNTYNISYGNVVWGRTSNAPATTDIWTHLVMTVDSNGNAKLYQNGILTNEAISYSTAFNFPSNFFIGGRSDGYCSNCLINDFRIYDHCLSVAEVKEISRGLILHYKLNEWEILMSKCKNINWNQVFHISRYDINNTYTINGVTITRNNNFLTFSGKATANIQTSNALWWDNEEKDHKYIVRRNLLNEVAFNTNLYNGIGLNTTTIQTGKQKNSNYPAGNVFKISITNNTDFGSGVTLKINIFDLTKMFGEGNEPTLEEFNLMFPKDYYDYNTGEVIDLSMPIPDSSGYGNHGTITGNLTLSNETSRYNSSALFNGIDSCITIPYKQINPSGIFTMNLWFKKDSLGTKNYETLFGGPSGFEMDTRANNASTLSLYMASVRGGNVFSPFNFGEWYMVTMVRDGTNEMYYINGELVKTIAAKSMPNGTYFIGAWQTEVKQNYYGLISDFRIYATALSAEDVKQLYEVSAKIDNLGNFHTYEFVENENNKIEKVGVSDFNLKERTGIAYIYKQVNPNLLQGTEIDNYRYERTSGIGTEFGKRFTPTQQLETGTYYTFSAMIRGKANMNLYTINTGGNVAFRYANKEDMDENEFKLFSITFRVTGNRTIDQIYPCSRYGESNTLVGDWYEVQENSIKLEEGNSCTPWIPAETDENYRNYNGMLVANQLIEI